MGKQVFGLDIGGTGIKGGIVDLDKGMMISEKVKLATPSPATPKQVAKTVKDLIKQFDWNGPIGCGFPAVIKKQKVGTANNISKEWIGKNVANIIARETGCKTRVVNDADAAGLCELYAGVLKNNEKFAILLTLGTGIGSCMLVGNDLLPNSELGSMYVEDGVIAEKYVSNRLRREQNWDWNVFGTRLDHIIRYYEKILSPEVIVLGGGAAKYAAEFAPYIHNQCPVKVADHLNAAGIIGAAMLWQKNMIYPMD